MNNLSTTLVYQLQKSGMNKGCIEQRKYIEVKYD